MEYGSHGRAGHTAKSRAAAVNGQGCGLVATLSTAVNLVVGVLMKSRRVTPTIALVIVNVMLIFIQLYTYNTQIFSLYFVSSYSNVNSNNNYICIKFFALIFVCEHFR